VKSILNSVKFLIFFGIGFGLLWYTFRNQSIEEIYFKISNAHLGWVFASLVISSLALISRSLRWNLLIEPLGYSPKLSSSFYSLMVGYFANLAIPRIGEISRCGALSKAENIPFNKLIGTVIIERFSDLLMLIVSIFVLALAEYELLGGFLTDKIINPILSSVKNSAILISVAGFLFLILAFLIWRWIKSPSSGKLKLRIRTILFDVIEGLRSVFRMKNGYAFLGHTLFIWVMYFLMMYVSFFAMDATTGLGLKAGLFVMVVGGIGMSAPVQGGIGTYHLLVSQGLMVYHISAEDGIAFATLVHTWQLILLIVLGTWSLIALFLKKKSDAKA
jgi:glycosyltransferase 2 family protein